MHKRQLQLNDEIVPGIKYEFVCRLFKCRKVSAGQVIYFYSSSAKTFHRNSTCKVIDCFLVNVDEWLHGAMNEPEDEEENATKVESSEYLEKHFFSSDYLKHRKAFRRCHSKLGTTLL